MDLIDIAKYSAYAMAGYTTLLFGAEAVQDLLTERIHTEEQLERVVREEANKLELKTDNIISILHKKCEKSYKTLYGPRSSLFGYDKVNDKVVPVEQVDGSKVLEVYAVELKEGFMARRGTVRHELYHIKKHLKSISDSRIYNFLRAFFYEEPTATLYALTGITFGGKK